jgi:hypothetical protein
VGLPLGLLAPLGALGGLMAELPPAPAWAVYLYMLVAAAVAAGFGFAVAHVIARLE